MNTTRQEIILPSVTTIEINKVDNYSHAVVDLKKLFGAVGIDYSVETEGYGIVKIDTITDNGMLYMSAGEEAKHGDQTSIAIRASDKDGDFVVGIMRVQIANEQSIAQVA